MDFYPTLAGMFKVTASDGILKAGFLLLLLFSFNNTLSQPFTDLLTVQYQGQPASRLIKDRTAMDVSFFQASLNAPFRLNAKNLLLINPFFEYRDMRFRQHEQGNRPQPDLLPDPTLALNRSFYTVYVPLTWQYTFPDTTHQLSFTVAPRINAATEGTSDENKFVLNTAVLYTISRKPDFTWKAGVYYSREFFGNFFLPLLAFDWQANERMRAWGILPRFGFLDYAMNRYWHCGLAYRGTNDSYRMPGGDWFRINEIQFRFYNDLYIPKTRFVLSADIGHTFLRNFTWFNNGDDTRYEVKPTEGLVIRFALAFRLVTAGNFMAPLRDTP